VWSGLAVVLICVGMIYFYKREAPPPELPAAEKVALPADSWYNQSWWSYISKYPSVRQIIQKSNETGGKIMSPQTARTFWISGKMSHAQGACFAQLCMDDEAPADNIDHVHTPEYVPLPRKRNR